MRIIIVGAGYVGVTLGVAAAKVGNEVLFVEINSEIVSRLNKRQAPFYEDGLQESLTNLFSDSKPIAFMSLSDLTKHNSNKKTIYVVSLGTPLGADSKALLAPITNVVKDIVQWMTRDDLLVLRSTVAVGTSRHLLNSIDGLHNISFCPERTIEGRALEELHTLPQIVSGSTESACDQATEFFKKITPDVIRANNLETAELIKLASNTFRDLNFAYANFLALVANEHDVNVNELIDLANFRYDRNIIARPGLVGGPCLEKDAYILAQSYLGKESQLLLEARKLNENMASRAVKFIREHTKGRDIKVLICGAAFKGQPVTSDTRGSFIFQIIAELSSAGISKENINVLDPKVQEVEKDIKVLNAINQLQPHYEFMIQLTNHKLFEDPIFENFVNERVTRLVSFWPRKVGKLKPGQSLYLGGTK